MNAYLNLALVKEDTFVHIYPKLIFPTDSDAYFYPVVQAGQDLKHMANVIYGDASFWVLISMVNKLYDPFLDLSGKRIKVLKPERVSDVSL